MLMSRDIENKFERITKKALPFLVLTPGRFRNELSKSMTGLFHFLIQRDKAGFDEIYNQINEMIDEREQFDSLTENNLFQFDARYFKTPSEMIMEIYDKQKKKLKSLEKRVKALEHPVEVLSVNKEDEIVDRTSEKDVSLETFDVGLKSDVVKSEQGGSIESKEAKCNCGGDLRVCQVRSNGRSMYACKLCKKKYTECRSGQLPVCKNGHILQGGTRAKPEQCPICKVYPANDNV